MPAHIGDVPLYGIPQPEIGVYVEDVSFDIQGEWYEQKNNLGKKKGVKLIDEEISFSLSGAVPEKGGKSWKLGATLVLANEIPDIWSETPVASTALLKTHKYNMKNTDAHKIEVGGTVYGFGDSSAA